MDKTSISFFTERKSLNGALLTKKTYGYSTRKKIFFVLELSNYAKQINCVQGSIPLNSLTKLHQRNTSILESKEATQVFNNFLRKTLYRLSPKTIKL